MSCNGPCRSIVLLYLSIALLFLVLADDEVPSSRSRRDFAVAGYLPEWRYLHGGTDWDAICEHLTHLIIFSIEVASNGSLAAVPLPLARALPLPRALPRPDESDARHGAYVSEV